MVMNYNKKKKKKKSKMIKSNMIDFFWRSCKMVKEKRIIVVSMHYQKQNDLEKTQNVCSKVRSNTTRENNATISPM